MPPKAKFTREQITEAALAMIREQGWEGLTARALAQRLGSSACPIFTVFKNMEEIQQAVLQAAKARYKSYVEKGLSETPAFKGVGKQYILFAVNEPKLFQLLFMKEQGSVPDLASVLPLIEESYDEILSSVAKAYQLGEPAAEKLYRHLWIYTHGIAALCATRTCRFTEQEISGMMTEVFVSLLKNMKEEREND